MADAKSKQQEKSKQANKQREPQSAKREKRQQQQQPSAPKQQQQPTVPKQQQQQPSAPKQQQQQQQLAQQPQAAQLKREEEETSSQEHAKSSTETKQGNRLHSHLDQFVKQEERMPFGSNMEAIHPAIAQLGMLYADGSITGSTARCMGLLNALKEVVNDYTTPENKELRRDFDSKLKPMIDYLKSCRPMSVSMGNALKYIKLKLHHQDPSLPEAEQKEELINAINTFIEERIIYTIQQIVNYGVEKIKEGDVILTFARSEVVERIFLAAKEKGKQFSVVIVDSRPKHEGRLLLRKLASAGVSCSFALINAVSHVMKGVSKVMLGAHTLFSNGTVMSRIGTATVAMTAHAYNVPVLVCCETYKFNERSQLDSITKNELADPDYFVHPDRVELPVLLSDWRNAGNTTLLNLLYDVTPMEFVDMVITEVGLIPPTSVPVILREYRKEI